MNQPSRATPSPSLVEPLPTPTKGSPFAWVSVVILGLLNAVGFAFAAPTLVMVIALAAKSDRGGISIIGLPEFFYVPAQLVLFLPSLVIVLVAAARRRFNLAYKIHLGVMVFSALVLLMDIVGLIVMLAVIYS